MEAQNDLMASFENMGSYEKPFDTPTFQLQLKSVEEEREEGEV